MFEVPGLKVKLFLYHSGLNPFHPYPPHGYVDPIVADLLFGFKTSDIAVRHF